MTIDPAAGASGVKQQAVTDRPGRAVRMADVLGLLLGGQPKRTAMVAATTLGVDLASLRAALSMLEELKAVEGTKKGTVREEWFSNIGGGTVGDLLVEMARLEQSGALPEGFASKVLPPDGP